MKTYSKDLREYATELIERYPSLFSTNVAKNMKLLAPLLKTKAGQKQAKEKERDILAAVLAQILTGHSTTQSMKIAPSQRKKRKRAKNASRRK